jgi:hypothetical protein
MLIYKIGRRITIHNTALNYKLICTFPEGNGYINVALAWEDEVRRFKLDPEVPTEVPLAIIPKTKT